MESALRCGETTDIVLKLRTKFQGCMNVEENESQCSRIFTFQLVTRPLSVVQRLNLSETLSITLLSYEASKPHLASVSRNLAASLSSAQKTWRETLSDRINVDEVQRTIHGRS